MKGRAAEVKEMLYVAVASVRQVLDGLAAFVNSTIALSPMHTVAWPCIAYRFCNRIYVS